MDQEELETSLRSVINAYNDQTIAMRVARDNAIRKAAALGMRQVDIVRITGYNRETIRQIVKAGQEGGSAAPTEEDQKEALRRILDDRIPLPVEAGTVMMTAAVLHSAIEQVVAERIEREDDDG